MSNTSSTAEHQVRRPGIKSSEGILTAITPLAIMAITWAVKYFDLDVEPVELAGAFITIGGAVIAYVNGRSNVKVSRNMASGAAAAIPNVAAGGDVNIAPKGETAEKFVYDANPELTEALEEYDARFGNDETPVFQDSVPRGQVIDSE